MKNRIRAAWTTFHKYRQELTTKNFMLKHRLRLFDAAITPTICYASGTGTTKEHERMIQKEDTKRSCTVDESENGQSSVSHTDHDSDVSFESDNGEEIDAAEIEEEDWVEYIKRSTNEAMEKMENENIRCWNMTHKK